MIIKVEQLVKRYKELLALDHFNLEIQEGEIYGLLGPNGSGKTTAINCILSLLTFEKGEVFIFGKKMAPDAYDIKQQIGVVMQNPGVYEELTVEENIDYFCGLYVEDKKKREALVEEAIDFVEIGEFRKFRPAKLSGGLLRRLNLACGIAHKPKLIILDEPTVAVDPQSRNKILEGIRGLADGGTTVLYTTHYMEEVEFLCDRISIMDKGKILVTGSTDEIKEMSSRGETLSMEVYDLSEENLQKIRRMENVLEAKYHVSELTLHMRKGRTNLVDVLREVEALGISYGRVASEMPTLNDVFLEITGKELRDHV